MSLKKEFVANFCPKCYFYNVPAYDGPCPKCGADLTPYKQKYSKDWGKSLSYDDFLTGLAQRIDRGDPIDSVVDYVDREFLWGAWGHIIGTDILLARDLRALLIGAYKLGKRTWSSRGY